MALGPGNLEASLMLRTAQCFSSKNRVVCSFEAKCLIWCGLHHARVHIPHGLARLAAKVLLDGRSPLRMPTHSSWYLT